MRNELEAYYIQFAATVVDGHVSPSAYVLAVVEELVHEVRESKATLLKDTCLSVLGEDHILGCQCRG